MHPKLQEFTLGALSTALLLILGCGPSQDPEPTVDTTANTATDDANPTAEAATPSFDYPGGWLDADRCVDICGGTPESPVERPKPVVCFDPDDADCANKTGDGDYDYLLLSQHWIPSMCRGLAEGYDTTVTHQAGATCTDDAPNRLTLHGLWPNYTSGFPQCCGSGAVLAPQEVHTWPEELRQGLADHQGDPTQTSFEDGVCHILNHEWQKHGTCFSDGDPQRYFEVGLELTGRLAEANATVDAWTGTTQRREDITGLYDQPIQLLCDKHHPTDLLEIHTCWSRDLELIACPDTDGFGSLVRCGDEVTLPLWAPTLRALSWME